MTHKQNKYTESPVIALFMQVHHNFWTCEVVWSRLKSHDTVKWSQVKSNVTKSTAVDLGSISASSRVMFLYRSDSQV